MRVRAFITHKKAERYSDCQDRFRIDASRHRLAVSDGMSESVFPDYWADILTAWYIKNGHCTEEERLILCDQWRAKVDQYIAQQDRNGVSHWRLDNSLAECRGGGATLCGIEFVDASNWIGQVIGDSCAISVCPADGSPFEILSSSEKPFDLWPDYYDSFPEKKGRGCIRDIKGTIGEDRLLLLASDPFAEFIQSHPAESREWIIQLLQLQNHKEFCNLVDKWRENGLHDDDSTVCIIEYDGSNEFHVEHQDIIDNLILSELKLTKEETSEDQFSTPPPMQKENATTAAKSIGRKMRRKKKRNRVTKRRNIKKH